MTKESILSMLNSPNTKIIAVIACIAITMLLAWQGAADSAVKVYLDDAIKNAAIIYGTARVMNALVSVIQSIDVSIVVVSIQLGDFLLPIHDTLERFADIMTISIVSLTLQRVLVEIVEANFFNFLLTASGIALCFAIYTKQYLSPAVKVFLTLFFVRFSLALVLMLNMAVDHSFITQKIDNQTAAMDEMHQNLDGVYQEITNTDIPENNNELSVTEQPNVDENAVTESNIDNYATTQENESSVWGTISNIASNVTETIIETTDTVVETTSSTIDAVAETTTDVWNKKDAVMTKLNELKEKASHWVEYFLTLMALMLLKTIILPLLFWYFMLQGIKVIWRKDWGQSNTKMSEPQAVESSVAN